jgi:O-antigen/teichoic acid export membrane protein
MGAVAVGEYLLLRRVASWLSSGMQLGLGVALPRYVARAVDQRGMKQLGYLASALICLLGVAGVLGGILFVGRNLFAGWLFGSPERANLIVPLIWMLLGLAAVAGIYGFHRGRLAMLLANAMQVINFAVIPIASVALFYRTRPVAFIVLVNGVTMFLASLLFLLPVSGDFSFARLPKLRPLARELLRYGVARVPGEFAGNALFALGPVLAAHYLPISEVYRLLLGVGLLMAISLSVTPFSVVLLSKVSMMIARNQMEELSRCLEKFAGGILELSVFICVQVVVFAGVLIRAWMGPEYVGGTEVIQITLLSVPFFLSFVAIRSAVDAATVVAHNAHNGYLALAVFLSLSGLAIWLLPRSLLLDAIAGALMIANAVLAWRTTRVARELLSLRIPWRECALPIVLALALGFVSYLVRRALRPPFELPGFILTQLGTSALFLWASSKLGSTWLQYFWRLLVRPSGPATV